MTAWLLIFVFNAGYTVHTQAVLMGGIPVCERAAEKINKRANETLNANGKLVYALCVDRI